MAGANKFYGQFMREKDGDKERKKMNFSGARNPLLTPTVAAQSSCILAITQNNPEQNKRRLTRPVATVSRNQESSPRSTLRRPRGEG